MKKMLFPAIVAFGLGACAEQGPDQPVGEALNDSADSAGDAARDDVLDQFEGPDAGNETEELANEFER
jgi:hypothetical protein